MPDSVEVSPLLLALLHTAAFLDLSDDEALDPERAGKILQRVGLYVQRLSDDDVEAMADDLSLLVEHAKQAGWPAPAREFVETFLENCGFELDGDDDANEGDADDADEADDEEEDADEDDAAK